MSFHLVKWMIKYILFFLSTVLYATPQYYCTASNDRYYSFLLNLIGSIHQSNFEELGQIFIYDLGLKENQIYQLKQIKKVQVCSLKDHQPELFYTYQKDSRSILGWYAWKPIVIKEILEKVPYVLWVDAGTLVLKNLKHLFSYLKENHYFLCAYEEENPSSSIHFRVTQFVREKFSLDHVENQWILSKGFLNGGIIGVNQRGKMDFLDEWHGYTKDLRYFEDDGSSLKGARHDLTLLSILAYRNQLKVFEQDLKQENPILLSDQDPKNPFFITWNWKNLNDQTSIYNSRGDFRNLVDHLSMIRWNKN